MITKEQLKIAEKVFNTFTKEGDCSHWSEYNDYSIWLKEKIGE